MGSWRPHSVQWGSGRIPTRWRCAPKQSCPTHGRNSATVLLLCHSVTLDISCVHDLWDSLVSNSCLYTLWNCVGVIKCCNVCCVRRQTTFVLLWKIQMHVTSHRPRKIANIQLLDCTGALFYRETLLGDHFALWHVWQRSLWFMGRRVFSGQKN